MNRFEEALIHFDRAIELKIEYPEALTNKGITLAKINRHQLALKQFDAALAINGNYVEAWRNKGNALLALGQYAEALPCYEKAKVIGAGVDDLTTGSYMHCQMFQNQWDLFANNKLELINRLKNQELVVEPFVFLSISDNPGLQLKCAQIASKIYSSTQIDTHIPPHARNDGKIKLAYFSADFKEHPVAYLTTELLESHDKEKFELFAFSFDDVLYR
jgi:predicted O-linked N-acetylglucosamine transferase (SPINDLY family)